MKLALIGYGKMGKAIEEIALSRGHKIVARSNQENPVELIDFSGVDVAIEFTAPEFAIGHIEHCVLKNTPVVVGTTAWMDRIDEVSEFVKHHKGSLIYASNFSIGVNILFDINRRLAKLMESYPEYKASIEEIHHVQKIDAPSGTAISLANGILEVNKNINSWVHGMNTQKEAALNQLAVTSIREDAVPGTHIIKYQSEIDEIQLSHIAHNRKGFALGAVIAAEWIHDKTGVFTMQDVIKF